MSSPFYVWDAEVHAGLPQTIQQAEAFAQQRPTEGTKSHKLAIWLNELNDFVSDSANTSSVDAKTIASIKNMMTWFPKSQKPQLEIEHIHVEDSEYFYRELVQSVQRNNLAAYDSNRGLFISKDYMLPQGIQPILEQEFAQVTKLEPSVGFSLDTMPKNAKQFQDLILAWFEQHDYKVDQFKLMYRGREGFTLERESSLFYETISMAAYYRGAPYVSGVQHYISVKSLYPIVGKDRSNPSLSIDEKMNILPHYIFDLEGLEFKGKLMFRYENFLYNTSQVEDLIKILENYLNIVSESLNSLKNFNDLINHNDDFNIKQRRDAPGDALYDLSLAKLCNDPLYEALYTKKIAYMHDPVWREQTIQSLSQVISLDNLK